MTKEGKFPEKDNYGATNRDIERGFTDGMAPNEQKKDRFEVQKDRLGFNEDGATDGGFLGRGRKWER